MLEELFLRNSPIKYYWRFLYKINKNLKIINTRIENIKNIPTEELKLMKE